jgi:undecaprenyl diphosphate synthase
LHTQQLKHIAIIMDGNGRWAQAQQLPRFEGHVAGLKAVKRIIQACLDQGVPMLSLFAFSSENWRRPETEVSSLMDLFVQALNQEIEALDKLQVSIRFTGNLTQLSPTLQEMIAQAQQQTEHHQRLRLNIAINYGGKWDILQATQAIAKKILTNELTIDQIDEAQFNQHLSTTGCCDPDLFIRTSGEQRISNYFLWQLAYTELYFTPTAWPDFDESHLLEAIDEFHKRKRRFGRTHHEN